MPGFRGARPWSANSTACGRAAHAAACVGECLEPRARVRLMSAEERKEYQRELVARGLELRAWWVEEMLATDPPLTERMTLFWHNHFTSACTRCARRRSCTARTLLFRREALGNFAGCCRPWRAIRRC